ncbi:diaminopimelate epimerase [Corynebacterium sp. CCM 9185]|uniref:Diaminopimelate epimerase n=1 Tax=Corynebacterium marambiense TaxID=2765364 RepID=A0ABS0VWH5_9CORY|nr:diaminopimelate epimerase [Corynebacterium marambiense]MBI9000649.1 diaminopimelate epimerase [Corynebacterium marambiense]MCK7663088.1 diaminopimelate epimerase [Corynebacterium marambiense]MCX7542702.1 diaminopimelate epimerase [Corynebacterium marambiense]
MTNQRRQLSFAKGHGTGNDFIILPDPEARIDLSPGLIRALCDRHRGIGADGILRVARAEDLVDAGVFEGLPGGVAADDWFMDYRNADGTTAEMCGNGVRVFAHWLRSSGTVDGDAVRVGTRAGLRQVRIENCSGTSAEIAVEMGIPEVTGVSTCTVSGQRFGGIGIDMGNPHLACVLPGLDPAGLATLPVDQPFDLDPDFFPDGANVEVLTELTDGRIHMRVHERGAGETLSCGTGTVAAAVAALADAGEVIGEVTVVVPGGEITVTIRENGSTLTGPSLIVAEGVIDRDALDVTGR